METKKICKCCGKYELDKDSLYEVCPICGWESDPVQEENPDMEGGANKLSLNQYKKKYKNNDILYDEIYSQNIELGNITINELDRIKTKSGRVGTVMLILHNKDNIGLEVEFDDTAPETETIDISEVDKIL